MVYKTSESGASHSEVCCQGDKMGNILSHKDDNHEKRSVSFLNTLQLHIAMTMLLPSCFMMANSIWVESRHGTE